MTSPVILVIADACDHAARALAGRWAAHRALLLTPDSLSARGWRHHVGAPESGELAIGVGGTLETVNVVGVYTRLSHVREEDLCCIVESDRAYVAAEMTSFLQAWLSELPCPVVNHPTPTCLSGPYWRRERWIHAAAGLGIPVRAVDRNASAAAPDWPCTGAIAVTVVGDRWFGRVDDLVATHALRLARLAEAEVLQAFFETDTDAGARFIGADLWPDVMVPDVADALLRRVLRA